MIVGSADDRVLAPVISDIEGRLGRPINYTVYPRDEVLERIGHEGDFIHEVFKDAKILLAGNSDDLLLKNP